MVRSCPGQAVAGGSVFGSFTRGLGFSGCSAPLSRSFFFLQVRSDSMEVVGEHSESNVALVSLLAFVGTAVQAVLLKGVDVAFDRAVRSGEFTPFFDSLTLTVRLAQLAFFGHDDGGDFEFQELAVFDAAEASIKADTLQSSGGKGVE